MALCIRMSPTLSAESSLQKPLPYECESRHLNKGEYCGCATKAEHFLRLVAGSDMRALVQEACQGPVRDAVAMHAEKLATLSEADLRPLNIRDFQVWHSMGYWSVLMPPSYCACSCESLSAKDADGCVASSTGSDILAAAFALHLSGKHKGACICRLLHALRGHLWSHQRLSDMRTMTPGMAPAMLTRVWVTL